MSSRNMQIDLILSIFFKFSKSKLLMHKTQYSDPKKDEDFMLMIGVAYHVLCKSADLLNETNISPWENKKTLKAKSSSNILEPRLLVMLLIRYLQVKLKKRGIPD